MAAVAARRDNARLALRQSILNMFLPPGLLRLQTGLLALMLFLRCGDAWFILLVELMLLLLTLLAVMRVRI